MPFQESGMIHMTKTLLATFDGEVLRPEEPLSLSPNTRVRVTIETLAEGPSVPPSFLKIARSLNLEGPADWSARLDDYLYGERVRDDD
jgi:hypothetical protein